jgi:hypothetical protein
VKRGRPRPPWGCPAVAGRFSVDSRGSVEAPSLLGTLPWSSGSCCSACAPALDAGGTGTCEPRAEIGWSGARSFQFRLVPSSRKEDSSSTQATALPGAGNGDRRSADAEGGPERPQAVATRRTLAPGDYRCVPKMGTSRGGEDEHEVSIGCHHDVRVDPAASSMWPACRSSTSSDNGPACPGKASGAANPSCGCAAYCSPGTYCSSGKDS